MLKVKEAHDELSKKSYRDIQVETAWKWASRAVASFENVLTAEKKNKITVWSVSLEYQHEAIEHAGSVESASFLTEIVDAMKPAMGKAAEELEMCFELEL